MAWYGAATPWLSAMLVVGDGFDCTRKKGVEERTKKFDGLNGLHNIQWREALTSFYPLSYDDINHLRVAVLERKTIRTKPNL